MGDAVVASLPRPSNVVFDVDGCLTLGGRAISGAAAALSALDRSGIGWLIATNNSTRGAGEVAESLGATLGMAVPASSVVTSADAVVTMLRDEDSPVLVVGEEGLVAAVAAAGAATTTDPALARSVVVGLHRTADYALLAAASRAVARGARFLASNTDPSLPHPDGALPGAGALVAAISVASGGVPEIAGKPYAPMLALVRSRLRPGTAWVVGDRPETDVALARAGGWQAVLVLSGVTADPGTVPARWRPDAVLSSVAALPDLL